MEELVSNMVSEPGLSVRVWALHLIESPVSLSLSWDYKRV